MTRETSQGSGLPADSSSPPLLNVDQLHALPSEQQDLHLLTFSSDLTRHVAALDAAGATAEQGPIKNEVIKIITLASPTPTRVIRNNLGACMAGIFQKGDRKRLYETISELLAVVNGLGKTERELRTKHAAVHCLGTIFEVAGDSAISSSGLVCMSILKLWKAAQSHAGFRAAILTSLGRVVKGIGRSVDEEVLRNIVKQARNAATAERTLLVQIAACRCLEHLHLHTPYLDNSNDYDKLQSTLWKVMDAASPAVRRSAASCLASVLIKSHSSDEAAAGRPKKRKTRTTALVEEEGENIQRPRSPGPEKPVMALAFSLSDILRQLSSQYTRSVSNRVRAAIAFCYTRILRGLEEPVQTQYALVARHFLEDLLAAPMVTYQRYRLLLTRRLVRQCLADVVGRKILNESSQLQAVRFLVNSILKDYPQSDLKERPEPAKETLTGALDALLPLIEGLGPAASSCADACSEGLIQVLQHPSHTVQIHTARCLKALVRACPQQLVPLATLCLNSLHREVAQLVGARRSPRRCLGFAYGLAAVISTASEEPLFGSVEVYSRVFSRAAAYLKSSSGSDLRISSTQIQVAWIMISGLMTLGPDFVKVHLSQLMLLWKNALPKPLSKDNIGHRPVLELSFLTHVRECALSSIYAFLACNGRLLTLDVSRRLAAMLHYTTIYLDTLPAKRATDQVEQLLNPSLQLNDYDLMLRRRVLQCYTQLFRSGHESNQDTMLHTNVVSLAASTFMDPDTLQVGSISSSIAASSGNFESIWDIGDNSAFGLTGLVYRNEVVNLFVDGEGRSSGQLESMIGPDSLDRSIRNPVGSDVEHDPIMLFTTNHSNYPDPLPTSVVNSAILLFSQTLVLQPPSIQNGALEQVSTILAAVRQQHNPAKEQALVINAVVALLLALHQADDRKSLPVFTSPDVQRAFAELLNVTIIHPDPTTRSLAAEAIGRLCKIGGIDFTSRQVTFLIDTIVSNREPHARAGCAAALGCIHAQLGGMAAGFHLKNIVGVLTSLASDPHPTVHRAALDALARVADSAGLAFSGFVPSTLAQLAQLYFLDSHNEEAGLFGSSNIEVDRPSCTIIGRCVDSMINALGPDLQDMTKTRNLLLTLTYQFQMEDSVEVTVESLRCLEHLSMYAPGHISFQPYVHQLQLKLAEEDDRVRNAALAGLFGAMRRDAEEVLEATASGLDKQLWLTVNNTYGHGLIMKLIRDWVEQSGLTHITDWIARIQNVLTTSVTTTRSTVPSQAPKTTLQEATMDENEPPLHDEEVAGFNAVSKAEIEDAATGPDTTQELLRWQARLSAMQCLNHILSAVAREIERDEHTRVIELLQPRIADVVRIAFSASTAAVVDIRIEGVKVLGQILAIFGRVPDPDFSEATLLEQYQAQISSALTPAFASDSSPALAAEAINVCATFISTGIVTDADRMGRILRLLVSALDDFSNDSETGAIGDLKNLSSGALVMVKLAVFSAWASLQMSSQEQKYLKAILEPHLKKLTPLWLSSLREYARLKFEPDGSSHGSAAGGLDLLYSSLTRRIMLKFYQSSWLQFVDAIASLIDQDSDFVFEALDGKDTSVQTDGYGAKAHEISYRNEPVAFFFVLFGISFEALARHSASRSTVIRQRMLEILYALKRILIPAVAGLAIYQDAIFSETMDLLDRLALTEGLEVQIVIVEIARNLVATHPAALRAQDPVEDEENLSDDIDQLFELTRIIVLVISNHVPNVSQHHPTQPTPSDQAVPLVVLALDALVDAAAVFPVVIRSDLYACIFHTFTNILSSAACQENLVSQALPIFRRFLIDLVKSPQYDTMSQIRSALARIMTILKTAQRRESPASLACERNALLASTILITTSAAFLPAGEPLLPRFVDELTDCLNNAMTTKVAAGLSRSLLLLPFSLSKASGTPATSDTAAAVLSAHLLPALLEFLLNRSDDPVDGSSESRAIITQALTAFALAAPTTAQKRAASAVVLPALLQRAAHEGRAVFPETSARLMELASRDAAVFRETVGRLNAETRVLLEDVLRAGAGMGGARAEKDDELGGARGPAIALRLDF